MTKPILFNTEMVQAILEGRKTVTRRIIKPQPLVDITEFETFGFVEANVDGQLVVPPCQREDILYVRETFAKNNIDNISAYLYKADFANLLNEKPYSNWKWKPSIHMPKEAARIFLKVTDVRVERLQNITGRSAIREGAKDPYDYQPPVWYDWHSELSDNYNIAAFAGFWDSIIDSKGYGKYDWNNNPWVWVIEFERIEKPNE